jgi:formylglycine-generating enzyme required for sulfatase activity
MRAVGVETLPGDLVELLTTLPGSVQEGFKQQTYWRYVPKGYAKIGSPEGERDRSRARERLTSIFVRNPFWMAEVHVTTALWALFDGAGKNCDRQSATRSEPVRSKNWFASTMFARWLSVHLNEHGIAVSLPTEWQWEYAARGKPVRKDQLAAWRSPPYGLAIVDGREVEVTRDNLNAMFGAERGEPGTCGDPARGANPLGLRDMMRFLWTWCANEFAPYLDSSEPLERPVGSGSSLGPDAPRAQRGGSFRYDADYCRAANRFGDGPVNWSVYFGLRLVCVRVSPQLEP